MSSSNGGRGLLRAVALPTLVTLIVLAAIVGAILDFSTRRSDELALVRQHQRVEIAVEQSCHNSFVQSDGAHSVLVGYGAS